MCNVVVCDGLNLVLPITAPDSDTYILELNFLENVLRIERSFSVGATISFPKTNFNEGYTYTGKVVDTEGAPLTFTQDGTEYDCFEFTTIRQLKTVIEETPAPV